MSDRKLKVVLPIAILALAVIVMMVMIKSRPAVPTRPRREFSPIVRTLTAEPRRHRIVIRTQGTVKPRTESTLVAEVAGRVLWASPSFASGGFFERADTLLRIDPRDYELALATAKSQVAQARVRLETERAQAEVAREEWRMLGNGDDSPLATRRLQVREAEAALSAAEAALEKAKRDLGKTYITAPYTGRIREKLADVGQYVAPGTPLASIYAIDYVEVRLPVPDSELAFMNIPSGIGSSGATGPLVYLRAEYAGKRHTWNGRIVRIEGEIDPLTHMVHVVAQVAEPYGRGAAADRTPLAVGLFVEAEIQGVEIDNAVIIPRTAVRPDSTVLIVDNDSRLRFRRVAIARMDENEAIVTSGLETGERICVSNLEIISDGMKVRVYEPARSDSLGTGKKAFEEARG